jgi:hypothetical protein
LNLPAAAGCSFIMEAEGENIVEDFNSDEIDKVDSGVDVDPEGEEIDKRTESVTSLHSDIQHEDVADVEDEVVAIIDLSPLKVKVVEDLPPVEEDILPETQSPQNLLSLLEESLPAKEVVEDEIPVKKQSSDDEFSYPNTFESFNGTNSTVQEEINKENEDPLVLSGGSQNFTSSTTGMDSKQDSSNLLFQYSMSTIGKETTAPRNDDTEDNSLFDEVDDDMIKNSKKKAAETDPSFLLSNRSSSGLFLNLEQKPTIPRQESVVDSNKEILPTSSRSDKKISPRQQALAKLKKKSESKIPKDEQSEEPRKSEITEDAGKATIDNEKKDELAEDKKTIRTKKGTTQATPVPSEKDHDFKFLTPAEMANQAEKQALKEKKEKAEKIQTNKLKKANDKEEAERKKDPGETISKRADAVHKDDGENPKKAKRRRSKENSEHMNEKDNNPNGKGGQLVLPEIDSKTKAKEAQGTKSRVPGFPSRFPAVLRNQIKMSKHSLELETSVDDSPVVSESANSHHRVKHPHSSPERRAQKKQLFEGEDYENRKPKKLKPLYIRMKELAQKQFAEEEQKKVSLDVVVSFLLLTLSL